ncbi:MAG: hypothetical protein KA715_14095 [Xanthomonadaceae bacterium]|nr:hypothetical protein [Xanthomonadaceae bacterium]
MFSRKFFYIFICMLATGYFYNQTASAATCSDWISNGTGYYIDDPKCVIGGPFTFTVKECPSSGNCSDFGAGYVVCNGPCPQPSTPPVPPPPTAGYVCEASSTGSTSTSGSPTPPTPCGLGGYWDPACGHCSHDCSLEGGPGLQWDSGSCSCVCVGPGDC